MGGHNEKLDGYSTEGLVQQTHKKRKRHQAHDPRTSTIGSPSPVDEGGDVIEESEGDHLQIGQSSDRETESQIPSSEMRDSQSEVDWESLLCEDIEMLPRSNWEAEFLEYQARMMANSDDRGLRLDESSQNPEDEPWYPYDPESMPSNGNTELQNNSIHNGMDGGESDQIVCFGAVSWSHLLSQDIISHSNNRLSLIQ